ncbi:(Fe-S)-binding protein [Acidobacteria bacterium AH-259-G07]|nr:(Fe-S)-binding protein [Acidobacteria bacterium AH-259-G07]
MTKRGASVDRSFRGEIARYIKDPISTTEHCRYSLMCRHVCPVGNITHSETLTPHGWALVVASVKRGLLAWDEESVDILYKCADCGLCQSHCGTNQPLPTAIAAARAEVVEQGLAPPQVLAIDKALQKWANPYAKRAPRKVKVKGVIGLYVGDAAQYLHPSTLEAALKLLEAMGVNPVLVGVGCSNGFLASSLGLAATATQLATAILGEVVKADCGKLLVMSPGDLYAFRTLYIERLNLTWPLEVEVVEATSFLYNAFKNGKLSLNRQNATPSYAYHDPCHSPRVRREYEAPRQLLSTVLGTAPLDLFWREQRAHPCGAVGGLEFTQPELATQLAEARFADTHRAGASLLITEDPLCLNQLKKHASFGIAVKGLYETLAEGINE